jgi:hypothetical protein
MSAGVELADASPVMRKTTSKIAAGCRVERLEKSHAHM